MNEDAAFIVDQVDRHHAWFQESLCLIASENVMSPLALEMYLSDFGHRYAEGLPGKRYYQGNTYVDRVEIRITEMLQRIFRCELADPRPISGTVANLSVLFGLTKPGDTITTVALSDGAHISTAKFGAVGVRGVKTVTYPWDEENMNIDPDGAAKLIREVRPKVALFGQSVFLFPTPLRELEDAFREVDCPVWYDAAHVLGLIAGGQFQDPLREGAHVISASTHKTLPGPQHGVVLANPKDEDMEKALRRSIFPGVVSNHHLHAMAALGIALAEWEAFGEEYAAQVIRNAQALGQALHERGMRVLGEHLGFTASHALALDVSQEGGGAQVALDLERANVITNKNLISGDKSAVNPSGLRLGSQELTRLGMGPAEMEQVADLIARVAVKKEKPAVVARDVAELAAQFRKVRYSFHPETDAYRRHVLVSS
ncbi:MAG: serine hydroxymethyltransferase [Candidatus Thermoplasmatota archaeon]|nr:serine hydroxymethyltransferase [Candidatus Thermoplasmatota archaeon]